MNNCVGFPNDTVANSYTTYNATAVTTTITRPNGISIPLNTTDRFCFTDYTGTNRDVQNPANSLCAAAALALATAITTSPSTYNITCTCNATTQLLRLQT